MLNEAIVAVEPIERLIHVIREQRVIVDADLARLYAVPTKRLNEQIRRNRERFPQDFMFQLTQEEAVSLRSQIATLEAGRGRHRKYLPYVFTEYGAIMAANVLNSERAITMSVYVVRAFINQRAISYKVSMMEQPAPGDAYYKSSHPPFEIGGLVLPDLQ